MIHEPLLLHIETSTEICSVAISQGDKVIGHKLDREGKRHAALLPLMIEEARVESGIGLKELDAICYSKGPGSYTGLRIGLSTAKGICFVLNKPLIGISTLLAMSYGVDSPIPGTILISMIDARRNEVYAEVYNHEREVIEAAVPIILHKDSFSAYLEKGNHLFLCGNGALKAREILKHSDLMQFGAFEIDARHMVKPGINSFLKTEFENLAYAVPEYLKTPVYKKSI